MKCLADAGPDRRSADETETLDQDGLRTAGLFRDLTRIRDRKPHIFSHVRHKLLADSNVGNYFGLRFEILLASHFIGEGVDFEIPDPPDFVFDVRGSSVQIECVSVQFGSTKNDVEQARRKIWMKVEDKAAKEYAKPSAALAIDVTNVLSYGSDSGHLFDTPNAMPDFLRSCQEGRVNRFGALMAFTWFHDRTGGALTPGLTWWSEPDMAPELMDFLNGQFPRKNLILHGMSVPRAV